MLKLSEDGYIHLRFTDLLHVKLTHLTSGLDDEDADPHQNAACSAITGYTEWLNDVFPQITIGWDWEMNYANNQIGLRRVGEPRSNVKLQDANQNDLGYRKSNFLQEIFIDGIAWQAVVQEQIALRYR